MHIDREDMLELTRRMTIARNCFNRVAGAYMDEEGFIDGSFNTHFLKLSPADKEKQLAIAKTDLSILYHEEQSCVYSSEAQH